MQEVYIESFNEASIHIYLFSARQIITLNDNACHTLTVRYCVETFENLFYHRKWRDGLFHVHFHAQCACACSAHRQSTKI